MKIQSMFAKMKIENPVCYCLIVLFNSIGFLRITIWAEDDL